MSVATQRHMPSFGFSMQSSWHCLTHPMSETFQAGFMTFLYKPAPLLPALHQTVSCHLNRAAQHSDACSVIARDKQLPLIL